MYGEIPVHIYIKFVVLDVSQELAKISHDAEEGEEEDEELDQHSRHFLKYAKQIREMKVRNRFFFVAGFKDET